MANSESAFILSATGARSNSSPCGSSCRPHRPHHSHSLRRLIPAVMLFRARFDWHLCLHLATSPIFEVSPNEAYLYILLYLPTPTAYCLSPICSKHVFRPSSFCFCRSQFSRYTLSSCCIRSILSSIYAFPQTMPVHTLLVIRVPVRAYLI